MPSVPDERSYSRISRIIPPIGGCLFSLLSFRGIIQCDDNEMPA